MLSAVSLAYLQQVLNLGRQKRSHFVAVTLFPLFAYWHFIS